MFNPLEYFRKFQSRVGKPIRPIVEIQKEGSIINVITTTIQDENIIQDTYRSELWEVHPEDKASAIYIDGIFKGMGYVAGEEGQVLKIETENLPMNQEEIATIQLDDWEPFKAKVTTTKAGRILKIEKHVELLNEDRDDNGLLKSDKLVPVLRATYKGLMSKLLDAQLYERGSALKASFGEKLVWAIMGLLIGAMMVMSYGSH